jgi:hypothetical protein
MTIDFSKVKFNVGRHEEDVLRALTYVNNCVVRLLSGYDLINRIPSNEKLIAKEMHLTKLHETVDTLLENEYNLIAELKRINGSPMRITKYEYEFDKHIKHITRQLSK